MNVKALVAPALALSLVLTAAVAHADDDSSSVLVKLAQMKPGSLPTYVTAFGQVEPSATAKESVIAPFGARIGTVYVQNGQEVAKGAPLMTVVPSLETRAAYKLAKDTLERTRSLAKAHLATASDLAKAESDFSVLQEAGASGPDTIRAPYNVIVLKVDAGQGAAVARGDMLLDIARPEGLVVQVGLDPAQALSVEPGDPVTLTPFSAVGGSVQGEVAVRGAAVNTDTGLVPAEIKFPMGKLLVGEMVHARITVGQKTGFIVPHAAIMVDLDDGTTYVMQSDKLVAKQVAVQVLTADGDQDLITGDDLNAKAPVVIVGGMQLSDGMKMRLADAAAGSGSKGAGSK